MSSRSGPPVRYQSIHISQKPAKIFRSVAIEIVYSFKFSVSRHEKIIPPTKQVKRYVTLQLADGTEMGRAAADSLLNNNAITFRCLTRFFVS